MTTGEQRVRGKFSKAEKNAIEQGIIEYMAERSETMDDFKRDFFRGTTAQTADTPVRKRYKLYSDLFARLAERCPGRTSGAVYEAVRRMYNPLAYAGPWTDEQDAQLRDLHTEHGPRWEVIGAFMGRDGRSVRDRFRAMAVPHESGKWSLEETERLAQAVRCVREKTGEAPAVGGRKIYCWDWVAAQVGTRNTLQCRSQWERIQAIARNDYESPSWTPERDAALLTAVRDTGATDVTELRWSQLVDAFMAAQPNANATFFPGTRLRNRWLELRRRAPADMDVAAVCDYLITRDFCAS